MIKQFLISTIESGKDELARTFQSVPDDKLTWRPLDNGRSAIDLAGDAAQIAKLATQFVQMEPGTPTPPLRETFAQMGGERAAWSRADVLAHLEANHGALIAVIEQMPDEKLGEMLSITMGPENTMTLPRAGWAMMVYRSYISRFAQINYIQTLYGDMDSH